MGVAHPQLHPRQQPVGNVLPEGTETVSQPSGQAGFKYPLSPTFLIASIGLNWDCCTYPKTPGTGLFSLTVQLKEKYRFLLLLK